MRRPNLDQSYLLVADLERLFAGESAIGQAKRDARKIERELQWKPKETFDTGLRKTVRWYLENEAWVRDVTSGSYREWIATHYSR